MASVDQKMKEFQSQSYEERLQISMNIITNLKDRGNSQAQEIYDSIVQMEKIILQTPPSSAARTLPPWGRILVSGVLCILPLGGKPRSGEGGIKKQVTETQPVLFYQSIR